MDRRKFLGLLGGSAAAAIALPEVPSTRSFFFGPWMPRPATPLAGLEGAGFAINQLGEGEQTIAITTQQYGAWMFAKDAVDRGILSRADAMAYLDEDRVTFIPEIWNAEILEAAQMDSVLADLTAHHQFNVDTLQHELLFTAHPEGKPWHVALRTEDLARVQNNAQLRGRYAKRIAYAFDRALESPETRAARRRAERLGKTIRVRA